MVDFARTAPVEVVNTVLEMQKIYEEAVRPVLTPFRHQHDAPSSSTPDLDSSGPEQSS